MVRRCRSRTKRDLARHLSRDAGSRHGSGDRELASALPLGGSLRLTNCILALQPSALGILGSSFPPSQAKSTAFATFSAGAPLGGSIGSVIGGV